MALCFVFTVFSWIGNQDNLELLVPLSYGWIVLYSLWMISFVFSWTNTCSECHIHGILLVAIPLIRSLYKYRSDLWYSSYLFGVVTMTVFTTPFYSYFLNSNDLYFGALSSDDRRVYFNVLTVLGIVNILYGFAYFMWHLRWIYKLCLEEQRMQTMAAQHKNEQLRSSMSRETVDRMSMEQQMALQRGPHSPYPQQLYAPHDVRDQVKFGQTV